MKTIVGFGALNLDLIFEVEDLKSISSKGPPLDPGEEGFGSDEEFESLLEQLKRFGTLKSKSGGLGGQYDCCLGPHGIFNKVHWKGGRR
jgi:ribokinase